MSYYNDIKQAATALNPDIEVLFGSLQFYESQTYNFNENIAVFVSRDFTDNTIKTAQGTPKTIRQISVSFGKLDTWDNIDSDDNSEFVSPDSLALVQEMIQFGVSVFWRFLQTSDLITEPNQQINASGTPFYRRTSNSYTGITYTFSFPFYQQITCA